MIRISRLLNSANFQKSCPPLLALNTALKQSIIYIPYIHEFVKSFFLHDGSIFVLTLQKREVNTKHYSNMSYIYVTLWYDMLKR